MHTQRVESTEGCLPLAHGTHPRLALPEKDPLAHASQLSPLAATCWPAGQRQKFEPPIMPAGQACSCTLKISIGMKLILKIIG